MSGADAALSETAPSESQTRAFSRQAAAPAVRPPSSQRSRAHRGRRSLAAVFHRRALWLSRLDSSNRFPSPSRPTSQPAQKSGFSWTPSPGLAPSQPAQKSGISTALASSLAPAEPHGTAHTASTSSPTHGNSSGECIAGEITEPVHDVDNRFCRCALEGDTSPDVNSRILPPRGVANDTLFHPSASCIGA